MKKVYLVSVSIYLESGSRISVLLHSFLSERKAKVYADFMTLQIERDGAQKHFGSCVSSYLIRFAKIRLDSEVICTFDWSDDLKKLQDEKSNLLEFV